MLAKKFDLNKVSKNIFYWKNCFEDSKSILLDLNQIKSINSSQWELKKTNKVRKNILNKMMICFNEYCAINKIDKNDYWISTNSIGFQYASPYQGMELHTDVMKMGDDVNIIPSFTMIAYLDNDYSGGEIFFEDIDIKPEAGSIVIFQNSLHGVREMPQGRRTIVMQPLASFKTYGNSLLELNFFPFTEENF